MRIFSVSELVNDSRVTLEECYSHVWVRGELSNAKLYPSGHFYFTIKDDQAQLSGVLFAGDARKLRFRPDNGLAVTVQGRLSIYPAQGKFQLISTGMEPEGKGALQLAYEQLKAKLQKEGLFEEDRKKPIPKIPEWIGLVTSLQGAAIRDMLSILNRRFANLRILIAPVRVQGEGAGDEIASAIRTLNRQYPTLDVLLVGRGGGSIEDLWAFNEEVVARAIAASHIPIISCVGHETDFTIADFVADLRAPTPSAAAELVVQNKSDLMESLQQSIQRLKSSIVNQLNIYTDRLSSLSAERIRRGPRVWIDNQLQHLDSLQERFFGSATRVLTDHENQFLRLTEKLQLLSPLSILGRGYALVWDEKKRLVTHANQLQEKDRVEVQLKEGHLYAQIERTIL